MVNLKSIWNLVRVLFKDPGPDADMLLSAAACFNNVRCNGRWSVNFYSCELYMSWVEYLSCFCRPQYLYYCVHHDPKSVTNILQISIGARTNLHNAMACACLYSIIQSADYSINQPASQSINQSINLWRCTYNTTSLTTFSVLACCMAKYSSMCAPAGRPGAHFGGNFNKQSRQSHALTSWIYYLRLPILSVA